MLHFCTSLNIYQNFHHPDQNYTKKRKLFLHCREHYVHQCVCVCVVKHFFTSLLSCRHLLALDTSSLLSVLLASVCFLISPVVWTVLGPMTIPLAQSEFGAFSHLVIIGVADPTTPFFKISSTLSFSSSPSFLLIPLHRKAPGFDKACTRASCKSLSVFALTLFFCRLQFFCVQSMCQHGRQSSRFSIQCSWFSLLAQSLSIQKPAPQMTFPCLRLVSSVGWLY